jgi:hypothetical protein
LSFEEFPVSFTGCYRSDHIRELVFFSLGILFISLCNTERVTLLLLEGHISFLGTPILFLIIHLVDLFIVLFKIIVHSYSFWGIILVTKGFNYGVDIIEAVEFLVTIALFKIGLKGMNFVWTLLQAFGCPGLVKSAASILVMILMILHLLQLTLGGHEDLSVILASLQVELSSGVQWELAYFVLGRFLNLFLQVHIN